MDVSRVGALIPGVCHRLGRNERPSATRASPALHEPTLKRKLARAENQRVSRCQTRRIVLAAAVCGVTATSCAGSNLDSDDDERPPIATQPPAETVRRIFTPAELDIDERGRPYDVADAQHWATGVDREALTTRVIPDGELRVMDGSAIQVDPAFFADEATTVEFDNSELEASIVWEVFEDTDARSVLAVLVSVPDAEVDRWEPFEYAYGTDGGVGGVTAQSVIDAAAADSHRDTYFIPEADIDFEAQVSVHDVDGVPGDDAVIFANGYGDGGFPMSRGLDDDGRLVSVAIVDTRYPASITRSGAPQHVDRRLRTEAFEVWPALAEHLLGDPRRQRVFDDRCVLDEAQRAIVVGEDDVATRPQSTEGVGEHGRGSGSDADHTNRCERGVRAGFEWEGVVEIGEPRGAVDPRLSCQVQHRQVDVLAREVGETGGQQCCPRDSGSASDVENGRIERNESRERLRTPCRRSVPLTIDLFVVGRSPRRVVLIGLVLGLQVVDPP